LNSLSIAQCLTLDCVPRIRIGKDLYPNGIVNKTVSNGRDNLFLRFNYCC